MSSLARTLRRNTYRRLWQSAGALGLAGQLLFPTPARAFGEENAFGGGLYVSFVFGERAALGVGVEGFATHLLQGSTDYCSNDLRVGVGGVLQAGLVNFEAPRLSLSMLGGVESGESPAGVSAELGLTYRFGERAGPGLHLGLVPHYLVANAFVRTELGLGETSVGVGGRSSTVFGDVGGGCAIAGRPIRTDTGVLVAVPASPDTRTAEAWSRDAAAELHAVFAFAELAEQLIVAEAPEALIARALVAGREELGHARACQAMAERLAPGTPPPTPPSHVVRSPLRGKDARVRLATESWLDGCLGEGVASAWAQAAARASTSAEARVAQQRIADEEARHAALAWDVMAWAARGDDDVRHALWSLRDVEKAAGDEDEAATAAHREGRLTRHERADLLATTTLEARRGLDGVLAGA
jgi:hypothetical protein